MLSFEDMLISVVKAVCQEWGIWRCWGSIWMCWVHFFLTVDIILWAHHYSVNQFMNESHFLMELEASFLVTDEPWWVSRIGFQLKGVITLQVQNEAKTPFKKFLLNLAISSKFSEVKRGIIRRNTLWDKLIFSRIQVGWVGPGQSQANIQAAHCLGIFCFSCDGQASL